MAVEANTRKRKHKNSCNEGGDDVVPKKMAKKIKSQKKKGKSKSSNELIGENGSVDISELQQEEDAGEKLSAPEQECEEAHENHDSGFEPEEERDGKFSKDFKMLNFRAKLRGTNFLTDLRHFLHLTQTRPRIIAKYIEKRGKPLELAEALERIDKTNVEHVSCLCHALQLVVMEIISNQKPHMESALHACRYFLKTHGTVLELVLNSENLQHRRIALKLLTAIVCVEPQLGRQLLSYNILSNVKTIENFLSHSVYELKQEDTVRKCYIHFVLAYLVDGNTLLIRNILDRGNLIRALASGLLYDDHVTVCVVLSTLKKYVLECEEISKTKKIRVFDLECCKNFVRLYSWHGPKIYALKFAKENAKSNKLLTPSQIEASVDPQELEAVAKAAHEFLVMLLSSRKFGIAFEAMTQFRQKHNVIQGKIIGFMYKPWCNLRKTELIVKILEACPDLARNTIRNFARIVNPVQTPGRNWVEACTFLTKLISTLHPRLLKNALDKITLTDFSFWIKDICLPIEVLVHINGGKYLSNLNYSFRLATVRLLLAMFTQYSNYWAAINNRESTKGGNSLRRFKFDIFNHILANFPTIDSILYSLHTSIKNQDDPTVNVLEHLEVTLDLVLIICKENRSFINKTGTILDYLKLLRPLYASDELGDDADNLVNIKLELKAIKTILLLFPKVLEPHEEMFASVMKSFIKAFVRGTDEVQREAGALLHGIFKNTGLFDAGELEIDLWLQALHFFDAQTVEVVTTVFIEVLQVTKADVNAPKSADTSTNESNLHKLFENIEQGLSVQAYIEMLSISKLMPLIFKGVEIVKPLDKYLEIVCLLMFHYYPTPQHVYQLYSQKFWILKNYMSSWLQHDEIVSPKISTAIPKCVPYLEDLQSLIICGGGKKFEEFFAAENTAVDAFEIHFNGKLIKFAPVLQNERMLLIYTQTIVFTVAQLVAKQDLKQTQATVAASFLKSLVQLAQEVQDEGIGTKLTVSNVEIGEDADGEECFLKRLLKYIFSTRISFISSADIFSATHASNLNYLQFLSELTESCNDIGYFRLFSANYRLKIVKAVAISIKQLDLTVQQSDKLAPSLRLVQAFQLDAENCIEILNLLVTKLKYSNFFNVTTCQKTIFYDLLVQLLQRLNSLQKSVCCDEFVRKCIKLYVNFVKKLSADINLEPLESALHTFLLISHQYIPQLDGKFFDIFFSERKLNKSTVRLACLLLERDTKLKDNFLKLLPENIGKKELIYPLLKVAFQQQFLIENSLLNSLYQEYKNGFMKTIEKPQKAGVIYKEQVESSLALIAHCMPKSECVDFCNKNLKFDVIELYQMKIINAIYNKAMNSLKEGETASVKQATNIFVNYINIQVQMLSIDLKKQTLDQEKLELFAFNLQTWLNNKPKILQDEEIELHKYDFTRILKSQQWLNFCKTALKLGMQVNESEDQFQKADAFNGLLLKLLAFLCYELYVNHEAEAEPTEPAQLFDMIFTHSKFFDIVLQTRTNASPSLVKTELLHLLYVLACKSPTLSLSDRQIPVILGAYQARLYAADRYALALLQLYEQHNCGLHKYRPFIWGESAIAFYALRAADEERSKLTQQETSIAQVMSLIDRQVCDYTIDNFPIWRQLYSALQLPVVSFEDPDQRAYAFGSNSLETRIELQQCNFTVEDLRLCPKRAAVYEHCYDPAFFIPLMSICFAPESYAHPARPVQNGLLSIVFAALSSQDREMRLAAGCAQQRYRAHFESNKFFERPLWLQAYDNIQSGLADLRASWMKHKRNSGTPRVPFISGLFVAKAFNITTEPTHLLYKQLTMYLRLKSSFNFQCIPEFNLLFYSAEVEHQQFREFIVEIIRNGIKSSSDLYLLVKTHTFKVLMGFYGSPVSSLDFNLLILSVFSTCVKIPASTKIMIEEVGLLPWLTTIIGTLEFYHFDIIEGVISILNNLWYALKANAAEFHNYQYICTDVHRLLLLLLPHLSGRIAIASFAKVLNILNKTVLKPQQYLAMSAKQLNHIIGCSRKHFPELIFTVEGIRQFGGEGAESTQQYCRRLHAQKVEPVAVLALSSLRAYVIGWWQKCEQQQIIAGLNESATDPKL